MVERERYIFQVNVGIFFVVFGPIENLHHSLKYEFYFMSSLICSADGQLGILG